MKRVSVLTILTVMLWWSPLGADSGAGMPLPALNDTASTVSLPGKFIFAEYFTSDIEAARRFYGGLFGWEWRWVSPDHSYGMFYQNDIAVAGVVLQVANDADQAYGRWIYYISTDDVPKMAADIVAAGGRVLLEPRSVPDRGILAVVADAEGAPFGLLDSTSGDPADYRAEPGEWLWVSLYSQDGEAASRFYRSQFGYEITEADDTGDGPGYFLSKGGYVRAGISHLSTESESHPTWVGYIRVEDVGGYVTKAVGLGGEVMVGQAPAILDGNLAVVSDPTGAPIALIHWNFDDQEVVQ